MVTFAAVAAERDREAELKTAAEMLLQRGRGFAGCLLTDVSLGPPREGRPSSRAAPGYRLPSAPSLLAIYVRSDLGGPRRGPARPRGKEEKACSGGSHIADGWQDDERRRRVMERV